MTQDVTRAGFYADGTVAASVTMAITIEIERARMVKLGKTVTTDLGRRDYERWSWEAWTKMSSMFLLSPPDHFGYMENPHFMISLATYLGQPCPVMAPVVGRFYGKSGARLDKYGANLAAASLPGQGHRALHNKLQSIVQAMMKVGGIFAEKEAVNFLLDKVGEPYITNYVDHVANHPSARNAPFAIVPDLHARNYPTGRQRVNDSGATMSVEALFEVKTYTACPTRYKENNATTGPAEQRATLISQEYSRKF